MFSDLDFPLLFTWIWLGLNTIKCTVRWIECIVLPRGSFWKRRSGTIHLSKSEQLLTSTWEMWKLLLKIFKVYNLGMCISCKKLDGMSSIKLALLVLTSSCPPSLYVVINYLCSNMELQNNFHVGCGWVAINLAHFATTMNRKLLHYCPFWIN